jgi:uncharacterized OsmC-like protein
LVTTFESRNTKQMNSQELRKIQQPLKQKYTDDPQAALITLHASGSLGAGISCKVETGRAIAEAGLHPATGGGGTLVCSGDMLLEALVACAGVTFSAVATALGITVHHGNIRAEGDLDFRGTLGVSKEVPVGFQRIRLYFDYQSSATDDQKASLAKLTERYCVVFQTLSRGTAVTAIYNSD